MEGVATSEGKAQKAGRRFHENQLASKKQTEVQTSVKEEPKYWV